jgi:hypothetical protein
MASSNMARFKLPVVKSWCDPRTDSRIELHSEGTAAFTNTSPDSISCTDIKTCTFYARTAQKMRQRRAQWLVERNEEREGPQQLRISEQQ